MNNKKKVYISIVAILAVMLVSIIGFKIIKNSKGVAEPEVLVSKKYEQVNAGDEAIDGTEFVTFDAFYLRDLDGDGYAEKLRGTCREIGTQDTLYTDLNVLTNGTLKNAKITINGKNFYFATALVKDSVISKDYIGTNTREIVLNDVNNGTQKLIFGMVQSGDYSVSSKKAAAIGNNTSKYTVTDNTVTLTGTHVADDGTETPITKTVTLTNDWHGTTRTRFYMPSWYKNQQYDIATAIDEENQKLRIKFKMNPEELDGKLIISKNHIEGELPLINGYAPENVTVNQGATVEYDSETRIFIAEKTATLNDNGVVSSTVGRDILYEVTVEYPLEAYKELGADAVALNIPIKTYYEGYNNTNTQFENPYKSNVAEDVISVVYKNPDGENARVDIDVGRYLYDEYTRTYRYVISKELPLNIYNNIETENTKADNYIVRWYISTGTEAQDKPIKLKETPESYTDKFVDVDGNYISMERYIANTGIYFTNASGLLGDEGYINVYNDETNELLHTFTKADWSRYSGANPYKYETPVKHIRIETSNVSKSQYLYVYNVKEIDDVLLTAEYTKADFARLAKIYSYVTGYMEDTKLDNDTNYANYEEPYSVAKITLDSAYISNQETKKNAKITISTITNQYNTKKWTNGEFLIKYPAEVIDVNINSVTPKDNNITITGVDTYEENGNLYTKIYTSNDTETQVDIEIDADITADPRGTTVARPLELYYYNPAFQNYREGSKAKDIYDINGNENTEDYVGKSTVTMNIIAPSNLLTSQTATNFDDKGSIVVAPQEATVDKVDGTKTATINLNVTNNYSGTISEVKIVGKIPFKGNTYQLNGADLGSTFDTIMTDKGIVLPEELKPYATIYYSYNEKVTEDLNATKNGWTTTPEDMSMVKNYLIDLGDYVMPVKNTSTFSYDIQIPSSLDYNQVSYSDHAIYYCLDTDQGKLKTQTEPNKLGFRIAEKYDLEITKLQKNTNKVVPGVVFSAQEVGTEETKTATTYSSGMAAIKNLYVEKEYIIKEIRTNNNYILNDEEIRIIGHIVNNNLEIEILEGSFKDTPVIEVVENANTKVKVSFENEVKYNFELNKTQTGTNDAIQGIRFELTDYKGKTTRYTTNSEGKLTLKLLEPNKQYTLTEVDSKGHYLKNPVSFMMVRDANNNLKFNVLSGELDTPPVIDETGEIPVVKTGLSNEKIPTYSLRITKKETDTENIIAGAQFKFIGENKADNILYTTDENGVIQIDNLYQYVEGKPITGEYTLQEIYPTEGYILNDTPVQFRAQKDATGNLKLELLGGTIRENVEDVQVDNTDPNNPIISITIDNDPVFTLTKVDAETGKPLEGVEFQITDMNGNDVIDANGNIIGVTEIGKITLNSTGNYPWTQNLDGTWQSGNYDINSSTSTLTSNEFKVDEKAKLTFDWSVSSESASYDYLYYTITNLDTNTTIGGTSTKIGGTSYGTEYDALKYNNIEVEINPGRYKIEFTYRKDSSGKNGLDRGFVKNVLLTNGEKGVKTDKNGKIRLSLTQGLYKAIETKPLEGYAKPDLYTGIGIGESKEAEYNLIQNSWEKGRIDATYDVGIVTVEDGVIALDRYGQLVKYDFDGNIIWDKEERYSYDNYYNGASIVDDGMIAVGEGTIVKYDFDGNIVWKNTEKPYWYYGVTAIEDGIVVVGGHGNIEKYDLEGKLIWENIEKEYKYIDVVTVEDGVIAVAEDGQVVKYDLNGNFVWENVEKKYEKYQGYVGAIVRDGEVIAVSYNHIVKYDLDGNIILDKFIDAMDPNDVVAIEDGIIVFGWGKVAKYDFEGNIVWKNSEGSNRYNLECATVVEDGIILGTYGGEVLKCDFKGNIVWNNGEKAVHYYKVISVEDGFITVESQNIVKYDLNGNFVWKNTEKSGINSYSKLVEVEDGIIAVGNILNTSNGVVVKYNFEGNIVWENVNETWRYEGAVAVEDGIIVVGNGRSDYCGIVAKYDLNGNKMWENTDSGSYHSFKSVAAVDDGVITVSTNNHVVKYDFDGNFIWEDVLSDQPYNITSVKDSVVIIGNKILVKYDLNGNKIWTRFDSSFHDYEIITVENGIIITANKKIIKCDFEGNILWENTDKTYSYSDITTVGDGVIAVSSSGKIVKYKNVISEPEIPASYNTLVENEIEKYKITTKVNGYGGNISGKDEQPYEEVRYKENSIKNIIAKPANGYKVQSITINDKPIDFVENLDSTVILDKFISMTEDKEVVVTFVKKNSSLIIKKQDSTNSNPLVNARFNIKQLETRTEPAIEQIAGDIIANGEEYIKENITLGAKVDVVQGILTNGNDTYYFVEENGKYVPNNSGVHNVTANSYIPIDLTNYTGTYAVVVNANISSESADRGYATITENTTIPSYSNSTGRFMYISGTSSNVTTPTDYMMILEGGKIYYLHLGYRKDGSVNTGEDKLTINSVNVYNATSEIITNTYNFIDNGNGGYESNNQGQASTVANSYIPLDLTNYKGKYNLIVNANVSSQSYYDNGYATITTNTTAPAYNNSTGRFIYISGTSGSVTTPKDYITILEGGKMYYLHLGYRKDSSTDSGDDKFTINSINLTLNTDDFVDEDIVTNSSGEAVIELNRDWKYQITEVEAPEGYTLDPTPIIYDFVSGQENVITVENNPQTDLIVHHYIKGTTTSVAPDENIKGDLGKEYSTSPKMDLEDYELVKNPDGSYQIPDNASGVFTEETQVVTYYYELKPLKLIVHHYLDGTEDSVAPDEISEGTKGQSYTTNPVTPPTLEDKYELVQDKLPSNATGTFEDSVTEVTYYYKLKEHKITTEVDGIGGTITGQGLEPYESVPHGQNSVKDIVITPDTGYEIESITINGVGQDISETSNIWDNYLDKQLVKFENVTEDIHIVVKFKVKQYDIFIVKKWIDNNNSAGKRPDGIKVEIYDGSNKLNEVTIDKAMPYVAPMSAEDNNEYSWANTITVPMIDENGKLIDWNNLSFVEKEINSNDLKFYTNKILNYNADEDGAYVEIENTFVVPDTTKDLTVTKKWVDNSNANGRRPVQIKLQVKNGDTVVQEQVIDVFATDIQSHTFTGLKEYADTGDEIQYTVDEVEVTPDGLKFYSKTIDNATNTITNTFTVPEDKISLDVTKKWEDNSNVNNTRPAQIKLQVKNGNTIVQEKVVDVTAENEKVYTFTDLAKYGTDGQEIMYTVDETEVNSGDLIGYTKSVSGTTITNTIVSHNITTEVKGVGGTISGQGQNPYETVVHGGTSVKDIVITPDENHQIKSITINGVEQTLPEDKKQPYTLPKFTNMVEDKHVIVTFETKRVDYTATKVWEDNSNANGKRPDSIEMQLYNGNTLVASKVIPDEVEEPKPVVTFSNLSGTYPWSQNADGTWQSGNYNINSSSSTLTSDVFELKANGTITFDWSVSSERANADYVYYTITNVDTDQTIGGESTKIGGKGYGTAYNSLTYDNVSIALTPGRYKIEYTYSKNASKMSGLDRGFVKNITLEQEKIIKNEWQCVFKDIPLLDEYGNEIQYRLDEAEVNAGDLAAYRKTVNGTTITNTLKTYNITTEVNGVGGTISGQGQNPYENVLHGENSVKDIVITPDTGYEIKSITINGVEQTLPATKDQPYTLSKFTNMTEDKHIIVEFKKKEYTITTEVVGGNGSISGETESPYEIVLHGENSVKDIVCTPDKDYKITSITVNGTEITFTPNADDTYTLPKFTNVTENKHVIVQYEKKDASVIVKHVTEEGTDIIPPETIPGKIGDPYTTEPKDFAEYELKTTPDNANGNMTEEQITVIYVYSLVTGKVTVTKVDNKDNTKLLSGATFKLEKLDASGNVDTSFTAIEKTTNETGKVEFTDIIAGKYKLTETQAPDGYQLAVSSTEVEINKTQREVNITAKNRLKLELPATGGIGLAIFAIVGISLMSYSIIANKKQSIQE